ncbi:S49 family peptidase [Xanthocytophaga flava]|uniref:S49 family peptidase n=1 Tax=Xanthocytophaga flava TaxID=3048013 RepID=UPI0028D286FD|nr:S49 family peptidase [Xanthocytophaga flavus]MDJ1468171.1 S49 family peptidase [Xanthocytophaga flavus]
MLDILLSVNAWALDSRYLNIYQPIILKRLAEGKSFQDFFATEKDDHQSSSAPYQSTFYQSAYNSGSQAGNPVTVQVIKIKGTMLKEVGACQAGTSTARVVAALEEAFKNPDVGAIVLESDTPGGAVDGTEVLGNTVKNAPKPVVTFVNGLTASAGYWVASQSQHIVMSSKTTSYVGSIGTLVAHLDESGWLAKEGYKVTYITADASVHKVLGNSSEPLSAEALDMFKARLNSINDTFISTVKDGRGKKLSGKEDVFTAKVYNGNQAIQHGLADSIGTIKDAINIAASLARKNVSSSTQSPKSNAYMSFPKLSALFNRGQEVSADAEVTEIQAANAENALIEKDNLISSLQTQLAAKDKEITDLKATHQATVDQLNTQIAQKDTAITQKEGEIARLEQWHNEQQVVNSGTQDLVNTITQTATQLSPNAQKAQEHLNETKNIKAKKGIA